MIDDWTFDIWNRKTTQRKDRESEIERVTFCSFHSIKIDKEFPVMLLIFHFFKDNVPIWNKTPGTILKVIFGTRVKQTKKEYQLGDQVHAKILTTDLIKRQIDLSIVDD